jgi:hypothetical protein
MIFGGVVEALLGVEAVAPPITAARQRAARRHAAAPARTG